MKKHDFEDRAWTILSTIVESYIRTAEPVGSRTLSKLLEVNLSPATIRNIMADLTEQGMLEQPYTSAGRVPTSRAYRNYVNALHAPLVLSDELKTLIQNNLLVTSSLDKTLETTTKLLADLTRYTSVVTAPRFNDTRLRQIEFIRVDECQVFVVLITQSTMVHTKLIEVSEDLSQEFLNSVSRYLTEQFTQQSLFRIRRHVQESLLEEKEQYNQLLAHAVRLSKKAFEFTEERALYVEGQFNIVRTIADLNSAQRLLRVFEEKLAVLELLDDALITEGVQIRIGEENTDVNFQDLSVVTAHYRNGATILGSIGVIGPMRMDYGAIIPVIDFTAQTLSQAIARN